MSLCLSWRHTGLEVQLCSFLTSAVVEGDTPASLPLGKEHTLPIVLRLASSMNQYWHFQGRDNLLPSLGIEWWIFQSMPFSLYWIGCRGTTLTSVLKEVSAHKVFQKLESNILSSRVVTYWLSTIWWYFVFVQCDIRGNIQLYLMETSVCQRKTDWIMKLVWEGGNRVEMGRVW